MNSPGPSPADIQHHLYMAFLERRTADVALHVHGSWEAVYSLHRVVLIQSDFFRSLFTSGFVESSPRLATHRGPEEINIVFDDRNITRAAFEVCISRLYGGGPPLHISPSLIPTLSQPLTPSFPIPAQAESPAGHHPATPRFLLSLLATAIYLSIPSVACQALNSILSSVGPHTVIQYLNFALGIPIDPPDEDEPEAAVGLDHVAELITGPAPAQLTKGDRDDNSLVDVSKSLSDIDVKNTNSLSPTDSYSTYSDKDTGTQSFETFHYGPISDKIGEAAACWLARWGPDMLVLEENKDNKTILSSIPAPLTRKRARTLPSGSTNSLSSSDTSTYVIPVIWARGGLNAKWISALVSSDTLVVKGERERYDFARSVVELRRRGGIDNDEEKEWVKMFREGIYYSNMSTEDIIMISRDISPTTGRTFVDLPTLQSANWTQSVLRHLITVKPSGSPSPSTPPPRDKELGITETTSAILSRVSKMNAEDREQEKYKPYYPVPMDSSLRLGDNGGIEGATMDQLFEVSSMTSANGAPGPKSSRANTSESNFFGLTLERHTASSCIQTDVTGKARWSPYPPFRFAVEFWDVGSLKEKSRLHSHTIWHAGSLFNIYVQVVRKKGVQLGIYIHRQSTVDPIPSPSVPSHNRFSQNSHSRKPSLPSTMPSSPPPPSSHYSPSIHPPSRSSTPIATPHSLHPTSAIPGSPTFSIPVSIPATGTPVMPVQPYRDPRPAILAYFSIACASATGSAVTRFASAPDVFTVSQSWGWKSSSLRTEEYLEVVAEGQAATGAGDVGREVSLRATVVFGLI